MWVVNFGGQRVTEDDATVGECATVLEVVHRPGWELMSPGTSPDVLAAWCIIALLRGGMQINDALMAVNQTSVHDIAAAFSNSLSPPPTNGGSEELPPEQKAAMQELMDREQRVRDG